MRAAVVGGGAYVAGRSMGRRAEQQQQAEGDQDQRISDLEQQQQQTVPAPQEQAPAAAATSPMIDQLNQLAALHQQGILSDDEFTAAKAKLFGT
jgi:hypothetical protein